LIARTALAEGGTGSSHSFDEGVTDVTRGAGHIPLVTPG